MLDKAGGRAGVEDPMSSIVDPDCDGAAEGTAVDEDAVATDGVVAAVATVPRSQGLGGETMVEDANNSGEARRACTGVGVRRQEHLIIHGHRASEFT